LTNSRFVNTNRNIVEAYRSGEDHSKRNADSSAMENSDSVAWIFGGLLTDNGEM